MIEVAKRRAIVERLDGLAKDWNDLDPQRDWYEENKVLVADAVEVVGHALTLGLLSDLRKYYFWSDRGFGIVGGRSIHRIPSLVWGGIARAIGVSGPEEKSDAERWRIADRNDKEREAKFGDWNNWPADEREKSERELDERDLPRPHLRKELNRHNASVCRTLAAMVAEAVTPKPATVATAGKSKGKGKGKGKPDSAEAVARWLRLEACIKRAEAEGEFVTERELARRADISWGGTWQRMKKKRVIAERIAKVCGPVERGEKSRRRKVRHIEGADTDGK
jgi:hypothetical protein